jgi:hypothetical protein
MAMVTSTLRASPLVGRTGRVQPAVVFRSSSCSKPSRVIIFDEYVGSWLCAARRSFSQTRSIPSGSFRNNCRPQRGASLLTFAKGKKGGGGGGGAVAVESKKGGKGGKASGGGGGDADAAKLEAEAKKDCVSGQLLGALHLHRN